MVVILTPIVLMVVGIPGSIHKPTDHPKAQPDEKLENVKRLGESHLYTEPELEKKQILEQFP